MGLEADGFHELAGLAWDFSQDLSGQISSLHAVIEHNELDEISGDLPSTAIDEQTAIAVEFFHRVEICIADTNNDHRAGHGGEVNHELFGPWHVVDSAVSQEQ